MKFSQRLKGLLITLTIAVWMPFIIFQFMFIRKANNGRAPRRQCRWFFPLNGLKLEILGEFDAFADAPGLIVLNHQSVADIICLEAHHPANICWVAKKELGDIPLYGWALKGPEMILLDRSDKKAIVELLRAAREKLAQGRPIVIFPEGTRSRGGEKFLPFKIGAKILAEKFALKIQPIVLINTRKIYSTSPIGSVSNTARMVILPSFTPDFADPAWYDKLREQMQATYTKHYKELNDENA